MTSAQLLYPIIALTECIVLIRAGRSQAQNVAALRMWLVTQIVIFSILEPLSLLGSPYYAKNFLICSLISDAADLILLYSIFHCLEDGAPAFGTWKAWGGMAVLTGMLFCFAAEIPLPANAHGMDLAWMTVAQMFGYIRSAVLIALALYGWLRASSWPRDLAWTWLGMAFYGVIEAVVHRAQILASNTQIFEWTTSIAALLQLAGLYCALTYKPKPLNIDELDGSHPFQEIPDSQEG